MNFKKNISLKQTASILLLIILSSCNSLKISKISKQKTSKKNNIIYALTKDNLILNFTLEQTNYIPGPYAKFSEKYLSIKPKITTKKTIWNIKKIKISKLAFLDTNNIYLIEGAIQKILPENKKAILASTTTTPIENNSYTNLEQIKIKKPDYLSFSLKKTVITDSKTDYKVVKTDSTTKKVPIVKKFIREKNEEEKASDAALLIRKIRKRRFRLAAGMNKDMHLDGTAVKEMITELNLLEEKYLSLFLGKTETITKQIHLNYKINDVEDILAYWSPQTGWSKQKTKNNKAIRIKIEKPQNILLTKPEKEKINKFIPYRIPQNTVINILLADKLIYQKTLNIAQFSILNYAPIEQLKTTNIFK